jgi:hypothetical protein
MGRLAVFIAMAAGVIAPSPTGPDGLLVLGVAGGRDGRTVTSELAVVVDPRTGRRWSRRLAGGTLCHGPLLAGGDGVVFSGDEGRLPVARTLPLDLGGQARSLGRADVSVPVGSSGRLLIGRARFGRRRTVLGPLRELSQSGRTSVRSRMVLPRWSSVEAGVDGDILVTTNRLLALWDPAAGRPRLSLRGAALLAAGGHRFAWCKGACAGVRVWTPHGALTVSPPTGARPVSWVRGAFSPDDRTLALAVRTGNGVRAAVVDLATGTWTVIRGAPLGEYQAMAWSPSGEWLVFTAARRRLIAWQRGARHALELPGRPRGTVMSVATAPSQPRRG